MNAKDLIERMVTGNASSVYIPTKNEVTKASGMRCTQLETNEPGDYRFPLWTATLEGSDVIEYDEETGVMTWSSLDTGQGLEHDASINSFRDLKNAFRDIADEMD